MRAISDRPFSRRAAHARRGAEGQDMAIDEHDPVLDAYLDDWLERRRLHLKPMSIWTYRTHIDAYIVPHLGERKLSEITRRVLEQLYVALLDSGGRDGGPLSPRTVELVHTVLRGALKDAVVDGLLAANPAEQARTPKRDLRAVELEDGPRVWTAVEAKRFLELVDGHRWRALWHLALGTGARRGELLGLRWKDVDLEGARVVIRRGLTVVDRTARLQSSKASNSRAVAIGESVVDALHQRKRLQEVHREAAGSRWSNEWGLVFTNRVGRYLHPSVVTMEFHRLVQELDVPEIRLHDLRHTNASLLAAGNAPPKVISDRLGHASIFTTMDLYSHVFPAADHGAADTFDAAIHPEDDQ